MYTATTLCYVRTDAGAVEKVAEGDPIPPDATASELDRLQTAGAIAERASEKPAEPSRPRRGA